MDKKIQPYRRLPSKPPGPKFQCCRKLYIVSSALGFDFCPPAPNVQPKGNIKIWGCRGDDNTAEVRFHRPCTVRGRGCSHAHIQAAAYHRTREDLGSLLRKSLCFQIPNSKLYFPFFYLFLLPNSDYLCSQAFAREEKSVIFFFFLTHGLSRPTLTAKT